MGGVLPVAGEVAIPVDAAGEARRDEGLDKGLELLRRQEGFSGVDVGVIGLDQPDQGKHALVPRPLGRKACGGGRAGKRPTHEHVEGGPDFAVEDRIRLAVFLEVDDVHLLPHSRAHDGDRIDRRAQHVGRVQPDHRRGAGGMHQRHLPHDDAAPVVADEDRLVDAEMVEQPDQIPRQVRHVVLRDRPLPLGPFRQAIAALVRRDGPDPRRLAGLQLMTPGKGELRPAVAEDHRHAVPTLGVLPHLVPVIVEAADHGVLRLGHQGSQSGRGFRHGRGPFSYRLGDLLPGESLATACSAGQSPQRRGQSQEKVDLDASVTVAI